MKRIYDFFRQGHLWDNDDSAWPVAARAVIHALRRLVVTVQLFVQRNLTSHAAALTYSSILGAVPVLAIVFAIARGFGFGQLIEEKLQTNVNFSPEMTATIMDFVNNYLERARGGVFIGVGLLLLFYTLFSLTSNIETAFNTIWQVRTSRTRRYAAGRQFGRRGAEEVFADEAAHSRKALRKPRLSFHHT